MYLDSYFLNLHNMKILKLIPVILSFLLLIAHFSRANIYFLMILSAGIPFLLFIKRFWVPRLMQILLILGGIEWIRTIISLINERNALGESWTRMAIILLVVALFTMISTLVFQRPSVKEIYKQK